MNEQLREWVHRNLAAFGVPGAVVALVKGDRMWIEPIGVRSAAGTDPVTESTVFSIASCAKALTATAAGVLVDEGVIGFDDPVHRVLPELELDDPWVTAQLTLRDLLAMRLGLLGVGVCNWGQNRDLPVARVLGRLKHLTRIAGFREAFTYLNPAYTAVAEIVSRKSGRSFAAFLQERIFAPLAMSDSFLEEGTPAAHSDLAVPHIRADGAAVSMATARCAGRQGESCVYVSGRDAARALAYHLSGRTASGSPLLAAPTRSALYSDQIAMPPITALGQNFLTYCMGWQACDFRGRRVLMHEGGELGVRSHSVLCAAEQFGVAVYATLASPEAVKSTTYHLLDRACGGSDVDWAARFRGLERQMISANAAALAQACPVQADQPRPRQCTGTYEHSANGRVRVLEGQSGLELRFDDASLYDASLEWLGGNVFAVRCFEPAVDEPLRGHLRLRLVADAAGKVTSVVVPSLAAAFARVD